MSASPSTPSAQGPEQQQATAAVAALWERFRPTNLGRLEMLEQAAVALREGTLDEELRQQVERAAHKLVGAVGTFGFAEGSRLAREISRIFDDGAPASEAQVRHLAALVAALRMELVRPSAVRSAEPMPRAELRRLLLVDDDPALYAVLAGQAAARGMRVEVVTDPCAARDAAARERPDVVLLSLSPSDTVGHGLKLLAELVAQVPPIPVLVLAAGGDLIDRVEVARLGAIGFLQKPIPADQVLEVVAQVLKRCRVAEAQVMVVDDDPQILAILHSLLEPRGLRLITLDDPLRFWEVLEAGSPDLLVLDVDMPHLSGIELCRVVRNDPRLGSLPVLFLTARTDGETVHRLFDAGADDYVSKPIVGPELVSRIANRLERSQLLRTLAETDALTGLANRSKATQVLDHFLRLSDRQAQPLSLAIMDLDHFKQINDRHGHATGDAVLRRVGQLLGRSFRDVDVVARWGGEEFAVGLYGATKGEALRRLSAVLEELHGQAFDGPDGTRLRVTFSAGIAEYPADGLDLQTLYRSADGALYQAKAAGRDRVLPAG